MTDIMMQIEEMEQKEKAVKGPCSAQLEGIDGCGNEKVGEKPRFCDACDDGGEGARQGREGGGRGARRMKTRERKRPDTSSVASKVKATR